GSHISRWIGKHPNASAEEIVSAKRSITRGINGIYGGQNWEALGRTKMFKTIGRAFFLAPDWGHSNYDFVKQTFGRGPGSTMARGHFFNAFVGAGILTEGLNYYYTGHSTLDNQSGYWYQVEQELANGDYAHYNLFGGPTGDLLSLVAKTGQKNIFGPAAFTLSKLAPGPKFMEELAIEAYMARAEKSWLHNVRQIAPKTLGTILPVPIPISSVGKAMLDKKSGKR